MWYNVSMKTKKKTITLSNGSNVNLFTNMDEYQFLIEAFTLDHRKVGQCKFNIAKIYVEDNATRSRPHVVRICVNNTRDKNISKDTYIDDIGVVYKYSHTLCTLADISILHDDYYKVGLGTALLQELEKTARLYGTHNIEAFYHPYGKYHKGTRSFYAKNGFDLTTVSQDVLLAKKCLQPSTNIDTHNQSHIVDDVNSIDT